MANLSLCAAILSAFILFYLIGYIFIGALPALTLQFITMSEIQAGTIDGAIANAIVGSIILALAATIIATPFAIGTAIYLTKYAPDNKYTRTFRFFLEVLSGTPSIVIGVFGFLLLVVYMKYYSGGYSLIAGAIGLAILILPVIERSTEEAIFVISAELEEGSYALGADKWQTLRNITVPGAMSGIITGIILGFGRAAEESAVVIFTVGYSQFIPEFAIKSHPDMFLGVKIYPLQDLVGTLPVSVYNAYTFSNVVPMSRGFAAAFVLVCVVLCINLSAKFVLSHMISGSTSKSSSSWIDTLKTKIFPQNKIQAKVIATGPGKKSPEEEITSMTPSSEEPEKKSLAPQSLKNRITAIFSGLKFPKTRKKPIPAAGPKDEPGKDSPPQKKKPARTFLRALLPFVIPALLLLLIALFAMIPPLHHAFTSVGSSDAWLLIIGPILIIVIVGIYLGFLFVDHSGMFKGKSRRKGFASAAAGICLLCIAGIICAMAAPGFFSSPVTKSNADRMAQLAALTAEYEATDGATSPTPANNAAQSSSVSVQPAPVATSSGGVITPAKDSLSVGESYQYGDATRTVQATVYDYKVLPFYFWWFIDYNRFVQQVPHYGNQYLVVFIRIENTGTNSAIVPSADMIRISNNGNTYSHDPYFNTSVLSSYQRDYYADNYQQLPYQWVRELGQDKRDYAYLTGYNIFGGWNTNTVTNPIVTETVTVSTTTSTSSSSSYNGKGFFIKPGPGNAVDGFLIFEVPDAVVKQNLDKTYVDISFNANSGTRWRLK